MLQQSLQVPKRDDNLKVAYMLSHLMYGCLIWGNPELAKTITDTEFYCHAE